ncbi:MAG: hypothetical protein HYZ52_00875 [Candidatus Omnitrophica bacterium]|nr:hypothetical protein [Candidatus Omnitrophota bacterium]
MNPKIKKVIANGSLGTLFIFGSLNYPFVSHAQNNAISDADLLSPPSGFQRLTNAQLNSPLFVATKNKIMPAFELEGGWVNPVLPGKPMILLGKLKLDNKYSKEQHIQALKQAERLTQKNVESGTFCPGNVTGSISFDLKENGPIIIQTSTIDCVDNLITQRSLKYFYVFTPSSGPDYELQLYIEGWRSEIESIIPALSISLEAFLRKKLFMPSFSENYYAIDEHQLLDSKDGEGNIISMQTITKVFDENTCKKIAELKGKSFGKWVATGSLCVKGTKIHSGSMSWDEMISYMFENRPKETGELYVSFTDLHGYQTRLQFNILAGPKYPVPGWPGEIPAKDALPLASVFIKSLTASGIKDARIIYSIQGRRKVNPD